MYYPRINWLPCLFQKYGFIEQILLTTSRQKYGTFNVTQQGNLEGFLVFENLNILTYHLRYVEYERTYFDFISLQSPNTEIIKKSCEFISHF